MSESIKKLQELIDNKGDSPGTLSGGESLQSIRDYIIGAYNQRETTIPFDQGGSYSGKECVGHTVGISPPNGNQAISFADLKNWADANVKNKTCTSLADNSQYCSTRTAICSARTACSCHTRTDSWSRTDTLSRTDSISRTDIVCNGRCNCNTRTLGWCARTWAPQEYDECDCFNRVNPLKQCDCKFRECSHGCQCNTRTNTYSRTNTYNRTDSCSSRSDTTCSSRTASECTSRTGGTAACQCNLRCSCNVVDRYS